MKEKLLELAKSEGLLIAEEASEETLKKLGSFAIKLLEALVKETENVVDDVAFAAVKPTLEEMIKKIDVKF